jgi:thymidylate synthase (FAD)
MKIIQPSATIVSAIVGTELQYVERIARTCYKSESRITETSSVEFVRKLRDRGHDAMLEFGTMSVRFICDRGVSHELVRHRMASFAQESTRYCDYGKEGEIEVVLPESIRVNGADACMAWTVAVEEAEGAYNALRTMGCPPQIARSVLPTCLKTEIVMQANFREWRHVFQQRTSPAAHPQMRELMIPLLMEVRSLIPVLFDDIEVAPCP